MVKQREQLSTDFVGQDPNDGVLDWATLRLGTATIERADPEDVRTSAEIELFMQDNLIIVIHKSTDKNALLKVPVGVNGETAWLPRDIKLRIPRKFVERLARAQEATYRTDDNPDPRMDEGKIIRRTNGQVFPFQVLHDPSPHGARWLRNVTLQG